MLTINITYQILFNFLYSYRTTPKQLFQHGRRENRLEDLRDLLGVKAHEGLSRRELSSQSMSLISQGAQEDGVGRYLAKAHIDVTRSVHFKDALTWSFLFRILAKDFGEMP